LKGKTSILFVICLLTYAALGTALASGASLLTYWVAEGRIDSIATGLGGDVYVTINNNHKVVKYSSEGEKLTEWNVDGVIETNGIAVGPRGDVYVTINNNHKVVKYSSEGEKLDEWSVDGVMVGIGVGPDGLVYVAFTNGMIQIFAA
jgi:sugar lactone lactonase YvrE